MSDAIPPLEQLNTSELLQILNNAGHGRLRLRRSLPRDRLIHLIRSGEQPGEDEFSQTVETRAKLEVWVSSVWDQINSQLPCVGPLRGKCTVYPCTEARHLECFLSAKKNMI